MKSFSDACYAVEMILVRKSLISKSKTFYKSTFDLATAQKSDS